MDYLTVFCVFTYSLSNIRCDYVSGKVRESEKIGM